MLLQASSIVDAEVGVAVSIDGPPVGATPAWSVVVGSSNGGSVCAGWECACVRWTDSRVRALRNTALAVFAKWTGRVLRHRLRHDGDLSIGADPEA